MVLLEERQRGLKVLGALALGLSVHLINRLERETDNREIYKTTNLITTTWKSGGGGADFLNAVEGLYRLKKI